MIKKFQRQFNFEVRRKINELIEVTATQFFRMEEGGDGPDGYNLKFQFYKREADPSVKIPDLEFYGFRVAGNPPERPYLEYVRMFDVGESVPHPYFDYVKEKLDDLYGDDKDGWGFTGYN